MGVWRFVLGAGVVATGVLGGSGAVAAAVQASSAGSDSADRGRIEEVVVTAERREQSLQDVSMAITALTEEDLQGAVPNSPMDLTAKVPNLRYTSLGGAVINYNIRGVSQNDFLDHLEPPISLYVDDAYLSTVTQGSLPIFDLNRVEVLRGPQGTLFGRNATGGLIHFISNQPTVERNGYVDVLLGEDGWGKFEGAFGGAISDNLQGRVSAIISSREGYIDNRDDGSTLGDVNYHALRTILAYQPSEKTDINVNLRYYKNYDQSGTPYTFAATIADEDGLGRFVEPNENPYGTCPGCGPAYYEGYQQEDPFDGSYTDKGHYRRKAYGATFKITRYFEAFDFISVTDLQTLDKSFYEDVDAAPQFIADDFHSQDLDHVTQEFRLSGQSDILSWTSGVYLYYQKNETVTAYNLFDGLVTPTSTSDIETLSGALYAQMEYNLSSQVSVVLGGRYTRDEKEIDFHVADPALGLPEFLFTPETQPDLAEQEFNLWSARAAVKWFPTEDFMAYAKYDRGTKGGGFGLPGYLPIEPLSIPFEDETLHAYEAGFKWTFLDGLGLINTAVFYYDYKDYQAFNFQTLNGLPVGSIVNRDGTIEGAEIELSLFPTANLSLNINLAHLDTEVEDIQLPLGRVVDRDFPMSPKYSGNASIRYEDSLPSGLVAAAQFDVVYNDDQSYTVLSAPNEREDSYSVGDVRLSLAAPDATWEVALFGKNIWDEEYRIFAFDLSSIGTIAQSYARPRHFGVSYRYNFR